MNYCGWLRNPINPPILDGWNMLKPYKSWNKPPINWWFGFRNHPPWFFFGKSAMFMKTFPTFGKWEEKSSVTIPVATRWLLRRVFGVTFIGFNPIFGVEKPKADNHWASPQARRSAFSSTPRSIIVHHRSLGKFRRGCWSLLGKMGRNQGSKNGNQVETIGGLPSSTWLTVNSGIMLIMAW